MIEKHKVTPQLWVTMGDPAGANRAAKVAAAAKALAPDRRSRRETRLQARALQPRRLVRLSPRTKSQSSSALKLKNVGIVYNLHHGHEHVDRFPELLKKMHAAPARDQSQRHGEGRRESRERRSCRSAPATSTWSSSS